MRRPSYRGRHAGIAPGCLIKALRPSGPCLPHSQRVHLTSAFHSNQMAAFPNFVDALGIASERLAEAIDRGAVHRHQERALFRGEMPQAAPIWNNLQAWAKNRAHRAANLSIMVTKRSGRSGRCFRCAPAPPAMRADKDRLRGTLCRLPSRGSDGPRCVRRGGGRTPAHKRPRTEARYHARFPWRSRPKD